jgi:hypothetical protein
MCVAAGLGENGISRVDEWLRQQQIPLAVNSHKVTAGSAQQQRASKRVRSEFSCQI